MVPIEIFHDLLYSRNQILEVRHSEKCSKACSAQYKQLNQNLLIRIKVQLTSSKSSLGGRGGGVMGARFFAIGGGASGNGGGVSGGNSAVPKSNGLWPLNPLT